MAIDREFPAVKRRLRSLTEQISDIERTMTLATPDQLGSTAIYKLEQYQREFEQTTYLLQYFERQNNGYSLSRLQWTMFIASLAVACTLLILFFLDRFL